MTKSVERYDPNSIVMRNIRKWREERKHRISPSRARETREVRRIVAEYHVTAQSVPMVQIRGLQ